MLHDFSDTFAFVKVVQAGSFTGAARALQVPKTRVSRKVQELERRLGVQLLKRTTRKLGLTEAGTVYFQHCEPLARELEGAEDAVAALKSGPRGWLRITAPYWLGCSVLAPLLSDFRDLYPEVRVDVLMGHEVMDLVSANIDIALRLWIGPLPDSRLAVRKLGPMTMRVYAAHSYIERFGQPKTPEELIEHRTLATSFARSNGGYAWPMRRGSTRRSFAIDPIVVASDPEFLTRFILAGQGLALTQELRMRPFVAQRQIVPLLREWTGPDSNLYALLPATGSQPAKTRAFLDFLTSRVDL
jgi:DNA-binding transcriptional LysR family regulator